MAFKDAFKRLIDKVKQKAPGISIPHSWVHLIEPGLLEKKSVTVRSVLLKK